MQLVPLTSIVVRNRQRKKIAPSPLSELKTTIRGSGLLHAPVIFKEGDSYILMVGERRFRAIKELADEKIQITYDNQLVQLGFIPVTHIADFLDETGRFEAELVENVQRVDIEWQEKAEALATLHTMRQETNPKQTLAATREELQSKGVQGHPKAIETSIKEAVVVARHLSNPKIAQARNVTEAFSLVMKMEEETINAAIARKQLATLGSKPALEVRHGNLLTILPKLDGGFVDLILADPPYGIDASGGGFRARTVHHHNYEDTVENARSVAQCILTEGFRLCKPRANLLMFTDIKHWEWLQTASANMGWTPFRRPMIWGKSDSEGLAPWGGQGPRITTEFLFYATKGEKGMLSSPTDYLRVNRVPRNERTHAAEKPVELLRKLIECTTLAGDFVLDPCCGSGSSLIAAKELRRQGLGIELDKDYFEMALGNVHGGTDAVAALLP